MPVIPGGKPPILTDNTTMTTASNQSMIPAIRYVFHSALIISENSSTSNLISSSPIWSKGSSRWSWIIPRDKSFVINDLENTSEYAHILHK